MRPPSDMPQRPRRAEKVKGSEGRGRVFLIVGVVVLFVLATSLRGIASFYTDYLWFESLSLSSVWRGVLSAKFSLVLKKGWNNVITDEAKQTVVTGDRPATPNGYSLVASLAGRI